MENRLPERAIHQFVPIDKLSAVKRFLDHWKPNLVLWFESELWPNLITEIHMNKIPMIMVNARLSDSAHKKWTLLRILVKPLLEKVQLCLPQTKQDGERLRDLGVKEIGTVGNLKYAAQSLPSDEETLWHLSRAMKGHSIWLASSTHAGEEEVIIEAHKKLKKNHPNILTIITPRSPDRGKNIKTLVQKMGFSASRRSANDTIEKNTDFYIADTLGELGTFYRLCPIVFVGGSLVPIGGHNILEAGQLGCAIIHGPHMENFMDISAAFSAALASIKVKSAQDLAHNVSHLIEHEMEVRRMGLAASQVVHVQQSILDDVVRDIMPFVPK